MNSSAFAYTFGNNYKDFVLKLTDFFVLCVLPSDVTDFHLVPVFQIVTDVLHSFILFQANTFILHVTSIFNRAELL